MGRWLPAVEPHSDDLFTWLLDVWHQQSGGDAVLIAGDGEDSMVLPISIADGEDIVRLTINAISNAEDIIFQPTWVAIATGSEVDEASSGDTAIYDAVSIGAVKGEFRMLTHFKDGLPGTQNDEVQFEALMLAIDAASAFLHRAPEEEMS